MIILLDWFEVELIAMFNCAVELNKLDCMSSWMDSAIKCYLSISLIHSLHCVTWCFRFATRDRQLWKSHVELSLAWFWTVKDHCTHSVRQNMVSSVGVFKLIRNSIYNLWKLRKWLSLFTATMGYFFNIFYLFSFFVSYVNLIILSFNNAGKLILVRYINQSL